MIKRLIAVVLVFLITGSNYFLATTAVKSGTKYGYQLLARKMFLESAMPIALAAALFA